MNATAVNKLKNNKVEWVTEDGLIQRFEGLNKNTLNVWFEVRSSNQFHEYVINPTHKLVWINILDFIKFLKWKAHERGF